MRSLLVVEMTMLLVSAIARADAPPAVAHDLLRSPRLAALQAKLAAHDNGAEAAFWHQLESEGAPIVEDIHTPGQLLVTFVWRGTSATRYVQLGGPVGMSREESELSRLPESNVFWMSLSLPDTGRFTYFFIINHDPGTEPRPEYCHHDPLNRHPYDVMSLFELPRAPSQPSIVAHRATAAGALWHHKIRAAKPQEERQLFVYTPAGYSPKGPAYPLLIAFDAESALGPIPLPVILDELIAAKRIPPVVALLIGNVDRDRDLPPNPAFADLVALDLVPWMREHYHATSDPRRTVISGISFGGLASAYGALRHPDVYGNVLSQSGSFWWGPKDGEPEATARDFATTPRQSLRFWMEVGTFEGGGPRKETTQLAANRHLRDVLQARGYEVSYREFEGEHSYVSWRGTIADGLIALLATPPKLAAAVKPSPTNRPIIDIAPPTRSSLPILVRASLLDGGVAALAAAKTLLSKSSEGYALDEDEIIAVGGMLMMIEHARDSVPLLQWGTERFPKSANAWDYLAWAYFMAGDRAHAVEGFKQVLALDAKNTDAATMLAELSAPGAK
jgi:enterochelin esterase-like enzyme